MKNPGEKILELFNNEGWEFIEPLFSSFEQFLNYLKKYNLLNQFSLKQIPDEFFNQVSFAMFQVYPDYVINYIVDNILTDVERRNDGYYLRLRDRSEVSDFFRKGNRWDSSRDIVNTVMGEDWYEPYSDTTDNVYRDVIDELSNKNLQYFKQVVLDKLKDVKIELDGKFSDEMELIASEQGHDEYFFVTPEYIDRIVDDSETMEILLDDYLGDIEDGLYSIHSQSYNDAYTDEIWSKIMNEISTYFNPDFITETLKVGDKIKYTEYLKINDLGQIISDYLDEYKDSQYSNDLMDSHGSFTSVLVKMMEELSGYEFLDFNVPDYPSFSKIRTNINELFKDYF